MGETLKSVLLTSFDTWKKRHISNSSDDLLQELQTRERLAEKVFWLRQLPVDFELAPEKIRAAIAEHQPDIVICCGMAERRKLLSVESNGKHGEEVIHTSMNIRELVKGLSVTRVSHNAGKFVCNFTYFSILSHIQNAQLNTNCLFVHVPVLHDENRDAIAIDFSTILSRLRKL